MRADVPSTGCTTFVVMDVTLGPGKMHDFHKHPDQDEMIIVKSGRGRAVARAGQPRARPPATRSTSTRTSSTAPSTSSARRPSCRSSSRPRSARAATSSSTSRARSPGARCAADAGGPRPRGRRAPPRDRPRPGARPGRGARRAAGRRAQPPRPARPRRRLPVPAAARARLGRRGRAARHGRGGRDQPLAPTGASEEASGPDFEILGGPDDGTFAELVAVPEENLYPKPARLTWEEAAALPLAGLTAYRALFSRGGLRDGETVLVLGAGSGVSTFAVQLAAQAGARVLVTSSSDAKIERARELGADGGVNYATDDWVAWVKERGGVDVVDRLRRLDVAAVARVPPAGRAAASSSAPPAGRRRSCPVRPFYFAQWSLLGTRMGSPADFAGLLARRRARRVAARGRLGAAARRGRDGARSGCRRRRTSASWCCRAAERHGVGGPGGSARRLPARRHRPRPPLPAARPRSGSPPYRVVGVDYRGHGRSSWEPPWSVEQHVADLVDTADALGIASAAWVGHSFGGKLVAELAARHPDRVERAVLLDPALHIEPPVAAERAELTRARRLVRERRTRRSTRGSATARCSRPRARSSRRRRGSISSRARTAGSGGSTRRPR